MVKVITILGIKKDGMRDTLWFFPASEDVSFEIAFRRLEQTFEETDIEMCLGRIRSYVFTWQSFQ